MRIGYGNELEYQTLALAGSKIWDQWNQDLSRTTEELPTGLNNDDILFERCGQLRMALDENLERHEVDTLDNFQSTELKTSLYNVSNPNDITRAIVDGWGHNIDPFFRKLLGKHLVGVLDSSSGMVNADKSSLYALHLAGKEGVKFVLDNEEGRLVRLLQKNSRIIGIETSDKKCHYADLTIIACEGWTPSILPETSSIVEATCGSLAFIKLPEDRKDLWERYDPKNMPIYGWGLKESGGLYGFPRTSDGVIKFGYRAKKYTNFVDVNGKLLSVPKTDELNITTEALSAFKSFIEENMPELKEIGITGTKMCWYTDSIDNSFLVDYVPGYSSSLFVCCGGSGHGFKFLPILGREVVKIIEGQKTQFKQLWRWRIREDINAKTVNGLEEGEKGPRVLANQKLSKSSDWKFHRTSYKL